MKSLGSSSSHTTNVSLAEREWEGHDRSLPSVGHYTFALYAAPIEAGIIHEYELETYGSGGSRLPMSGVAGYMPDMEVACARKLQAVCRDLLRVRAAPGVRLHLRGHRRGKPRHQDCLRVARADHRLMTMRVPEPSKALSDNHVGAAVLHVSRPIRSKMKQFWPRHAKAVAWPSSRRTTVWWAVLARQSRACQCAMAYASRFDRPGRPRRRIRSVKEWL